MINWSILIEVTEEQNDHDINVFWAKKNRKKKKIFYFLFFLLLDKKRDLSIRNIRIKKSQYQ